MSTYALIGDIHANEAALEAVLNDIGTKGIADLVCVGDIVGYGAKPNECVDAIRQRNIKLVLGNHDYAVAFDAMNKFDMHPHAFQSLDWTRKTLSEPNKEFLRAQKFVIQHNGSAVAHCSFSDQKTFPYTFTEYDNWTHFFVKGNDGFFRLISGEYVCFIAHTHIPLVLSAERTRSHHPQLKREEHSKAFKLKEGLMYVVNVGSVGQPRDKDPRACYVTFDDSTKTLSYHRVKYDIAKTQSQIRQAGLPERLAARLSEGK